jgi:hypothetical protein
MVSIVAVVNAAAGLALLPVVVMDDSGMYVAADAAGVRGRAAAA